MQKLVEVQATKEFANTFLNDIFFKMAVNRVLDAAPAVEGVTIQKWIPVSERLPKPGTRVLVCVGAVFEAFIDDAGIWQRYNFEPLSNILGQPTH